MEKKVQTTVGRPDSESPWGVLLCIEDPNPDKSTLLEWLTPIEAKLLASILVINADQAEKNEDQGLFNNHSSEGSSDSF